MFIDKATITVIAGRGGNGAVSFHREKYVSNGGPNGGDGGRGGDVIVRIDDHMSTLMDFRYKRKYTADSGADGSGRNRSGKDGESIIIKVPRGTLIKDKASGGIICDMSDTGDFILARGGRGGWGNRRFATPTRQAPRFAKPGLDGQRRDVELELKLLADVGLIGFPNVGKSTLLSAVSKANPKIADYHFTTLFPNLGVAHVDENTSFILADIPGIIEGAAQGAGLGHDFLRHVDRCRLLLHVVDISGSEGRDPIEDYVIINSELGSYSPELAEKPQILVANKCDLLEQDGEELERFRNWAAEEGLELLEVSAATGAGTAELIKLAASRLAQLPPVAVYEADYVPPEPELGTADDLTIEKEDDLWIVEGKWLERLLGRVNLSDYESRMYFDRVLRESGVFSRMEALGISEGDTVLMYDLEFEYRL
jgi:GTP-binding protein